MSPSLFSHAPDLPDRPEPQPPVHCEVTVPHAATEAFEGFTDLIHLWWPVDSHSVYGEGSHVEFEDRVLTETSPADEVSIWGDVLDWQPPVRLRVTWHPGTTPATAGTVDVEFAPAADGSTVVRLTHTGWERDPEGASRRAEYAAGWPPVLHRYVRFMGGTA
ncbi:SRPBCC domain-containing protein [Arthrobacter sp. I2-34]|uniref:SRPBCC domain-containing protein n=1 Tax=Arthrobacter hankyongi TaxID=2904801 RepID=A0ABS9LEC2_9MICC|nr:SRPBCC domain-containing protein [Arthrobacter hankyongi]MCG2624873.1 SRPBCC domain-containing protein [Arthrobacter hankyongi]